MHVNALKEPAAEGKCAAVCKVCCMQSIWGSMYHCAWSGHSETFYFINPDKTWIFVLLFLLLYFCSVELWTLVPHNVFEFTVCIHIVYPYGKEIYYYVWSGSVFEQFHAM